MDTSRTEIDGILESDGKIALPRHKDERPKDQNAKAPCGSEDRLGQEGNLVLNDDPGPTTENREKGVKNLQRPQTVWNLLREPQNR